jgi:hypothetical protein
VLVSWERCHCAGAQTLNPDRALWGHFTVVAPWVLSGPPGQEARVKTSAGLLGADTLTLI